MHMQKEIFLRKEITLDKEAKLSKRGFPALVLLFLLATALGACEAGRIVISSQSKASTLLTDGCNLATQEGCEEGYECQDSMYTPDGVGTCVPIDCTLAPCPEDWTCQSGKCVPNTCDEDKQCPNGWSCQFGICVPEVCTDNDQCPPGWSCYGGKCAPDSCALDEHCPPGWRCQAGKCVPETCTDNSQCPPGWTCHGNECVPPLCTEDSHCPPGWICRANTCVPLVCIDGKPCPPDWVCHPDDGCLPSCNGGKLCPPGWTCHPDGLCRPDDLLVTWKDTGLSGTTLPLAWTGGRLVIGTSAGNTGQVHFFNPSGGALSSSADVGALTGLATVGNSGRVVFTNMHRISGMDLASTLGNACARSDGILTHNASFPYGPTLLSVGNDDGTGNWRFAVPVVDTQGFAWNDHRLLAYLPSAADLANRCVQTTEFQWGPAAPLAWLPGVSTAQPQLVVLQRQIAGERDDHHLGSVRIWDNTASAWTANVSTREFELVFTRVIGMAVDKDNVWIAAQSNDVSRLHRGPRLGGIQGFQTSVTFCSPPALGTDGSAYVVVQPAPDCEPPVVCPNKDYEIHRYRPDMSGGYNHFPLIGTLSQQAFAAVGSPLLGQPVGSNPAEVYVVTTGGTVHAFRADTLAPLWVVRLLNSANQPIRVHPTAQPVLNGNRLWVMGTQGELRSVLVNSNGLSRSARWPKMHRDNCNSNSHLTTSASVNCF